MIPTNPPAAPPAAAPPAAAPPAAPPAPQHFDHATAKLAMGWVDAVNGAARKGLTPDVLSRLLRAGQEVLSHVGAPAAPQVAQVHTRPARGSRAALHAAVDNALPTRRGGSY